MLIADSANTSFLWHDQTRAQTHNLPLYRLAPLMWLIYMYLWIKNLLLIYQLFWSHCCSSLLTPSLTSQVVMVGVGEEEEGVVEWIMPRGYILLSWIPLFYHAWDRYILYTYFSLITRQVSEMDNNNIT